MSSISKHTTPWCSIKYNIQSKQQTECLHIIFHLAHRDNKSRQQCMNGCTIQVVHTQNCCRTSRHSQHVPWMVMLMMKITCYVEQLCGCVACSDNSCIADAFCVHVRLTEAIGHQEMLQVNVTSLLHYVHRLDLSPQVRHQLVSNVPCL